MKLATLGHDVDDVGACISSGSFKHDGMVIAPSPIKTLSAVERRKLALMIRETPLHLGHVRLMTQITETGAVMDRT